MHKPAKKHYFSEKSLDALWDYVDKYDASQTNTAKYQLYRFIQRCFPDIDISSSGTWELKRNILIPYIWVYVQSD